MTSEESKLLVELRADMRNLTKHIESLTEKMDEMQKTHVTNMTSQMAVMKEKVGRLERILYGLIAVAGTQMIYIILELLKK
jgi:tetrahydromethanopterin S-methyltransferase subunit G